MYQIPEHWSTVLRSSAYTPIHLLSTVMERSFPRPHKEQANRQLADGIINALSSKRAETRRALAVHPEFDPFHTVAAADTTWSD